MTDEHPGCALCRRGSAEIFVLAGSREFCLVCLIAMGDFGAEPRWVAEVWREPRETGPKRPELPAPGPQAGDLHEAFMGEIAGVFELAQQKLDSPEEAETHLDLSIAYREMGLWQDALGEVAIALRHARHLPRSRAAEAVRTLLDPAWLRMSIEETLAFIRSTMFAN